MKTQLIMLDTPIIVSKPEQVKLGNWYYEFDNMIPIYQFAKETLPEHYRLPKIIAGIEGLPVIDWNGLEEEFGWVDVEKLANNYVNNNYPDYLIPIEKSAAIEDVIWGFNKAQSLNDKKFSLEDMLNLVEHITNGYVINTWENRDYKTNKHKTSKEILDEFTQSLQQPKVFDIEVETEDYKSNGYSAPYKVKPKITNNSIKIINSGTK